MDHISIIRDVIKNLNDFEDNEIFKYRPNWGLKKNVLSKEIYSLIKERK